MENKCINCSYFLNCQKASEEIRDCDKFIKVNTEKIIKIMKGEN